jgi:transposase
MTLLQVRVVDETAELLRSLKEERQMLLEHRTQLRTALHQVLELADGHDDPEETLMVIAGLAEAALKL